MKTKEILQRLQRGDLSDLQEKDLRIKLYEIKQGIIQSLQTLLKEANCGHCANTGVMQPHPDEPNQDKVECEWCKRRNEILEVK